MPKKLLAAMPKKLLAAMPKKLLAAMPRDRVERKAPPRWVSITAHHQCYSRPMFGPFVSRLVFRTLGIALHIWSLVRIYIAIELYRTLPPGGEFTPWVAMFAFVVAVWGTYDLLSSALLIALRNWAKYLAFISFALHGACGYLLFYEPAREVAIGIIAVSATCAALLVLCGNLNDPDKQPEP